MEVAENFGLGQLLEFPPGEVDGTLHGPEQAQLPGSQVDLRSAASVQNGPLLGPGLPRRDTIRAQSVRADDDRGIEPGWLGDRRALRLGLVHCECIQQLVEDNGSPDLVMKAGIAKFHSRGIANRG
jgi:hypothetical protein